MSECLSLIHIYVYHYHLHVVYIPVVEKEIRWTKRCKDKSLVGKVKETIMQVSMSKKWASKSILDEATGEPLCTAKGKPVLRKSYSVLQDDFFEHMRSAGYDNVERGERGSSEEHLTVMQFKTEREQERLAPVSYTHLDVYKRQFRTYEYTVAVRAVRTNDFMTCESARLSHDLLYKISNRITNEVKGVHRVVYDLSLIHI